MKTHGWFGTSWGAPCCDPEDHVPTPIGRPCLRCREPIRDGDQGLISPLISMVGDVYTGSIEPTHIDCFLKTVLPHGPECPHCRGKNPSEHAPDCRRNETGLCSCTPMPEGTEQVGGVGP